MPYTVNVKSLIRMSAPKPKKFTCEASPTLGVIEIVLPSNGSVPNPNPVTVSSVKSTSKVYARYCACTDVKSACETGVSTRVAPAAVCVIRLAPMRPSPSSPKSVKIPLANPPGPV